MHQEETARLPFVDNPTIQYLLVITETIN